MQSKYTNVHFVPKISQSMKTNEPNFIVVSYHIGVPYAVFMPLHFAPIIPCPSWIGYRQLYSSKPAKFRWKATAETLHVFYDIRYPLIPFIDIYHPYAVYY